jgi:anthranilate phosphoribosyltransferase
MALLSDRKVELSQLQPQLLGLAPAPIEALKGGNVEENAEILRNVLQGKGTQAQQDAVALNASLALQVGEVVFFEDRRYAVEKAKEILKSGAAWSKLEELVRFLSS